jgi:ubiquinone biosynthesis protein Coq4
MKKGLLRLRSVVLVFLTHSVALPLLKLVRRPTVFVPGIQQLKVLPAGSLGNDLYLFLDKRQLPLLQHYARHDLKHVLLGYDTTDEGEACLQSFMLGNGRVSFPVVATVIYSFFTMPEYWQKMRQAFAAGQKAASIHHWNWNDLLGEQTSALKQKIFHQ